MALKILKLMACLLFFMSGVTMAAEQNLTNSGRWSEAELTRIIASARQIDNPGKRIVALSSHFIDAPYVPDTLIGGPQEAEQLVLSMTEFDCFTLLDVIEALRRASDANDFPEQLKQVRYRTGMVRYENRRHFFSDWIAEDDSVVSDVTAVVGQRRVKSVIKQLNLKSDNSYWLEGIDVAAREVTYIPASQIDTEVLSALQAGDYVGIYSDHAGLDVSHTGLIVKNKGNVMLRHASSRSGVGKVIDENLPGYLEGKSGLVVYRVKP